tara:strand:- start:13461 stop:13706 length:246 start_codon:yes stop_codon:yes gene_type:complete
MSKAFIIQYSCHEWNRNRKPDEWKWSDLQYGEDEDILWLFNSKEAAKLQIEKEKEIDLYFPIYRVTEVTWDISDIKKGENK